MYYVEDKKEQESMRNKVDEFYKYDNILMKDLDFSNKFKYCMIYAGVVSFEVELMRILELFINHFNEDYIDIFVTNKLYIEECEKEGFYPSIHILKEDFSNKEAIIDMLLNYPKGNDGMGFSATNICAYSSSFQWIFAYDKISETACFVSNDKEFLLKMKKKYSEIFPEKIEGWEECPVLTIDDLLKFPYYYAKTKEEFNTLAIAKLEIV